LWVGTYDPADGARLRTAGSPGQDRLLFGTVEVR
jgi:hypothetical protein